MARVTGTKHGSSVQHICAFCSVGFSNNQTATKFCSRVCFGKYKATLVGEKNKLSGRSRENIQNLAEKLSHFPAWMLVDQRPQKTYQDYLDASYGPTKAKRVLKAIQGTGADNAYRRVTPLESFFRRRKVENLEELT